MERKKRKNPRLGGYQYNSCGKYFITICTQNRNKILWNNGVVVGNDPCVVPLNDFGYEVEKSINNIADNSCVDVDKYVIMPNHLHLIISISYNGTTQGSFPTSVPEIIKRFKTATTKTYIDGVNSGKYLHFNQRIWQKSYYDHIIRGEEDYLAIWKYIDENPLKWKNDEYYL